MPGWSMWDLWQAVDKAAMGQVFVRVLQFYHLQQNGLRR